MKTPTTDDLERVLNDFFRHPSGMFIWSYKFSVRSGWGYEGMDMYAHNEDLNYYFREHLPADEIDDAAQGRKTFGEVFGTRITSRALGPASTNMVCSFVSERILTSSSGWRWLVSQSIS